MKIEFGKYVVTSDPHNLILSEKRIAKKGKNKGDEYEHGLGYYGTLEALAAGLLELRIKRSDADSLNQLVLDVQQAKREIAETIRRVWDES